MTITSKYASFSCFLLTLALASVAHAQCSGGINTGGGNCTPPTAPGMSGANAVPAAIQQNGPRYTSQWGAIVIDDPTGGAGTVIGRDTERAAVHDATKDCESHGARDCKVVLTYANKCAALAWASGGYIAASRDVVETAESDALHECSVHYKGCKIVYSACSEPKRVN